MFSFERGFVEKFKLVTENLGERNYMLNSAPYLNKPLEMVVPCSNIFFLIYYMIGVNFYHFLSYCKWIFSSYEYKLPRPKFVSKSQMHKAFPHIRKPTFGVSFYEGQFDDSRLILQTLLTCSLNQYVGGSLFKIISIVGMTGATLGNYIGFKDFIKDEDGVIQGAILFDYMENKEFKVKAKSIVNCTGIFTDTIRQQDDPSLPKRMATSRGVHCILPDIYTPEDKGLLVPKTKDGRIMFILPYKKHTIAGTTDHAHPIEDEVLPPKEDVNEIRDIFTDYFTGDFEKDMSSSWCGIRPLVLNLRTENGPVKVSEEPNKLVEMNAIKKPLALCKKAWHSGHDFLIKRGVLTKQVGEEISTKSLTRNHVIEVSKSGKINKYQFE